MLDFQVQLFLEGAHGGIERGFTGPGMGPGGDVPSARKEQFVLVALLQENFFFGIENEHLDGTVHQQLAVYAELGKHGQRAVVLVDDFDQMVRVLFEGVLGRDHIRVLFCFAFKPCIHAMFQHIQPHMGAEGAMRDVVVELGAPDVGDLIELEALCFDYHWTEEQFLLGLEAGAFKVIGVRRGGILAGYMAFSLIADEMEILNLAVHPDFRRQGMGEALLARSFEICRQSGIAKSFLDVKVSNDPALALYRKFGYKKIGIRKKYYPDTKEDALLFRYDFQNNEA